MGPLKSIYYKMKLKDKILISYIALLLFWLSIFYYSHHINTREFDRYLESSVTYMLEQAESNLSYRMQEMMHLSNQIFFNNDIQTILENDEIIGSPIYTQYGNYVSLYDFVSRLSNIYETYNIKFYLMSRLLYTREEISFYHADLIRNNDWFQTVLDLKGKPYWTFKEESRSGDNTIYFAEIRVLKNLRGNFENILGILSLEMKQDEVYRILERLKTSPNTEVYLVDETGRIEYSMGTQSAGDMIDKNILEGAISGEITFMSDDNNQRIAITGKPLINSWSIITVVPYMDIMKDSISRRNANMMLGILMSLISVATIFISIRSTSKRLEEVANRMVNTDFLQNDFCFDIKYEDEIGFIEVKFNEMIIKIQGLISEVKTIETKKSKAELVALQSQINPHFLYNIMDTINWMAIKHKAYNISKVVTLLGDLLRISLIRDNETVKLRDELEHVKLYVAIELIRFKNSFEVHFNVDEELLDHLVLRTILQPLVENSIKHGMRQNNTLEGKINIDIRKVKNAIKISVIDNGPHINNREKSSGSSTKQKHFSSGYGLSNIKDRLELYYQGSASLEFEKDNDLTRVCVTIPLDDQSVLS